jgi:hypothetical protein
VAKAFSRFDPVELQSLVRPLKPGQERELHIVHEVFMDMIREAQGIAAKSVVGKPALLEVTGKR